MVLGWWLDYSGLGECHNLWPRNQLLNQPVYRLLNMASLLVKAGDAPHPLTGHMDSTTKHRENIMKKLFNGDPMIKYDTQMDRMKQLNWIPWFSASNIGVSMVYVPCIQFWNSGTQAENSILALDEKKTLWKTCSPAEVWAKPAMFWWFTTPIHKSFFYMFYT